MDCLPIALNLPDHDLARDLTRYVEQELGWQVVVDSPELRAQLFLSSTPVADRPYVLISTSPVNRDQGIAQGAVEVIHWPQEAARLHSIPAAQTRIQCRHRLVVSQVQPGVGASTLLLAIGATYAWAGMKVALAADARILESTGMKQVGRILACPNLWLIDPEAGPPNGFDLLLVQSPLGAQTQLVIGRPDRALLRALRNQPNRLRPPASLLVATIGGGEYLPDELRRIVNPRRYSHFEWSQRIARAGLRGALPQAFPGRFLSQVATLTGLGKAYLKGHRQTKMREQQGRPLRGSRLLPPGDGSHRLMPATVPVRQPPSRVEVRSQIPVGSTP